MAFLHVEYVCQDLHGDNEKTFFFFHLGENMLHWRSVLHWGWGQSHQPLSHVPPRLIHTHLDSSRKWVPPFTQDPWRSWSDQSDSRSHHSQGTNLRCCIHLLRWIRSTPFRVTTSPTSCRLRILRACQWSSAWTRLLRGRCCHLRACWLGQPELELRTRTPSSSRQGTSAAQRAELLYR